MDKNPQAIVAGVEKMINNQALRENIHEYLYSHEYGNSDEVEKYCELFER